MKILVMCGAGASSTFVAQRLNSALAEAGLPHTAWAGSRSSLLHEIDTADMVLVGPQLADTLDEIRGLTAPQGAPVQLLPEDITSDLDGSRTLALVREALTTKVNPS
ncbi:PTS sugar transporter subunit IIB [Nesterenkonia flava]|uniref:PTS sugar transporter n=1 Tax=Nesterenkonia flava TaxID=469799 RepID=A0ABU1FQQ3_9MICC|nr:PTS sugar transporter [Nesterenkonia flava]MDR5710929.1 PTS sugar transporter [Nesterenkonia flava]